MAGGGVHGKAAGIARGIMTGAGLIITMFQTFIMTCRRIGGDITEIITGKGTAGTINGFLSMMSSETGRDGRMIDIGRDNEPGVFKAIIHYRKIANRK